MYQPVQLTYGNMPENIYMEYNIGLLTRWFDMIKLKTVFVFRDQSKYMSVSRSRNCFPNNVDNVVGQRI